MTMEIRYHDVKYVFTLRSSISEGLMRLMLRALGGRNTPTKRYILIFKELIYFIISRELLECSLRK